MANVDKGIEVLANLHHDLIVTMQAAFIEWQYGDGAESAMQWIVGALDEPGLIPDPGEPYGKDAQAYFDANQSRPFPRCYCGRPSNILWMRQGFCSKEHYDQARREQSQQEAKPDAAR